MEWRAIPGYEGHYEISDTGAVRCVKPNRERDLKPRTHVRDGHAMYNLSLESVITSFTAARLVCLAWHGPALGRRVEHIDGDVRNDTPDNLRWMVRG